MPKIGDRIKCIAPYDDKEEIVGKYGKIVGDRNSCGTYAIEFDECINGHSCNGQTKDGRGYYLDKQCFITIKNEGEKEMTEKTLIEKIMTGQVVEDYLVVKENITSENILEFVLLDFFKNGEKVKALIAEAKRIEAKRKEENK